MIQRWLVVVVMLCASVGKSAPPAHGTPEETYDDPRWISRLANAKSLRIRWIDTVADRKLLEVTGENLVELKSYFTNVIWHWAGACMFHRDAVLVLPDETEIGLCFGCGQAETTDERPYYFTDDAWLVRVFFEQLLGMRPLDRDPDFRGDENWLRWQERKRQDALRRKKVKP